MNKRNILVIICLIMAFLCSFSVNAVFSTDDIVLYYSCDTADITGNSIDDLSSSSNDGTFFNGTNTVTGNLSQACAFNRSLQTFLRSDLNISTDVTGSGNRTIEFWIYLDVLASSIPENAPLVEYGKASSTALFRLMLWGTGSDALYFQGFGQDYSTNSVPSTGRWHHVVIAYNGATSTVSTWLNGADTAITDQSKSLFTTNGQIDFAYNDFDNVYTSVKMDEIAVWNFSFVDDNVTERWNNGQAVNPFTVIPNSSIDILFSNQSDGTEFKTLFGENEELHVYLNWTDSSDNFLNDSDGECNMTFEDGIFSARSDDTNFTICDSPACDFEATYSNNFSIPDDNATSEALFDRVAVQICHESTATADLIVEHQCGATRVNLTISQFGIQDCVLGTERAQVNFSECVTFDEINVTLFHTGSISERHFIENIEAQREYVNHTIESTDAEIIYNGSYNLWRTAFTHKYFLHSSKNIYASCDHNSDSGLNIDGVGSLNIENIPPILFMDGIRYSDNSVQEFNQTGLTLFEHLPLDVTILYDLIDDDLVNYTFRLINGSGDLVFEFIGNDTLQNVTFDETVHPHVGNTYNLSLLAFDTLQSSYVSHLYNMTPEHPDIEIFTPENLSIQSDNPLGWLFHFHEDEVVISCGLWINQTGVFTLFDNITGGVTNQTENVTTEGDIYNLTSVLNYYNFEENDTLSDIIDLANNNNATNNGVTYVSSKGGNGTGNFSINVVGTYGQAPNQAYHSFGTTQDFTISAWIRSDHASDGQYHMIVDQRDSGNDGVFLAIASGDEIQLSVDTVTFTSGTLISDANWHHIVATVDRDNSALSDIYIDNVSQSVGALTNGVSVDVTTDFFIARRSFSSGIFWEGDLDDIILFNKSLSANEISTLYQEGLLRTLNETTEVTTTLNITLNASNNFTLNATFPTDITQFHAGFINCTVENETVGIMSDIIYYNYSNDFTAPTITYIHPTVLNHTYNIDINWTFTTDEPSDCVFNDTAYSVTFDNTTHFIYEETTLNNTQHGLNITCTDQSFNLNSHSDVFNYTKDKEFPIITFGLPANNSLVVNTGFFNLVFNVSDNNNLFSANISIVRENNGDLDYTEENVISGGLFQYNELINTSTLVNDTLYILTVEACDSHTSNKLKKTPKVKKSKTELRFDYGAVWVKVKPLNGLRTNVKTHEKLDRYQFEFNYDLNETGSKYYELSSNRDIHYLTDTGYKGHFVINGEYWLDFEQSGDVFVTEQQNNKWLIEVINYDTDIIFDSIGELNCVNESLYFTLIPEPLPTLLDFRLDLNNQSHVFLIFVFTFFFLGLVWISLRYQNFAFGLFAFLIGALLAIMFRDFSNVLFVSFIAIDFLWFIALFVFGNKRL